MRTLLSLINSTIKYSRLINTELSALRKPGKQASVHFYINSHKFEIYGDWRHRIILTKAFCDPETLLPFIEEN